MLVKSSQFVDVSGLCRIEYIINWERKYEVRDLRDRPNLTGRSLQYNF